MSIKNFKHSGFADLPLHGGHVPRWLSERMGKMGLAIIEAICMEFGKAEVIRRLSDPFWFQSLGCVMGMDWHSSGITTSVMGALKRTVNPHAKELGIFICGGGKSSRLTPQELVAVGNKTGLDGGFLAKCSKLSAKVDNTAVQDGFQLYLHNFVVTDQGDWTVIQQGMKPEGGLARRYHWHSSSLVSFVEEPHTAVCGVNQGEILNMVAKEAALTRETILGMKNEHPSKLVAEAKKLKMPDRHDVQISDVNLKRLGSVLWLAHEKQPKDFAELLLLEGLGPRTLQSLTMVSEIVYGTPSRFKDPARFSFAHGGKDGHPFPVPLDVYDESIRTLKVAVEKAKIGQSDKQQAIKSLCQLAMQAEKNFRPNTELYKVIETERKESWKYGGMTVFGKASSPGKGEQLKLW